MTSAVHRERILLEHGALTDQLGELLAYNSNVFQHPSSSSNQATLAAEPFVSHWQDHYLVSEGSVFEALKVNFPQLNFPVRTGISQSSPYRAATLKGDDFRKMPEASGLKLNQPNKVRLDIYPCPAGAIPVLTIPHRNDFELLVQAMAKRNEPVAIPPATGAVTVAGFTNWTRIRAYRQAWEAAHPGGLFQLQAWPEWSRDKANYQDTFILLSEGPYSNVPAAKLGLEDSVWLALSQKIRRDHEATHYFTRRRFKSMRNNIMDELMADYMGIVAAVGHFRADWFLAFMGLEDYPRYRSGGRLENYCTELSEPAIKVVQSLVVAAAQQLEHFDRAHQTMLEQPCGRANLLMALTWLTLEELADPDAETRLLQFWNQYHDSAIST